MDTTRLSEQLNEAELQLEYWFQFIGRNRRKPGEPYAHQVEREFARWRGAHTALTFALGTPWNEAEAATKAYTKMLRGRK